MLKTIALLLVLAGGSTQLSWAQSYFGMRFSSNLNYFPRAEEHTLAPGAFTTGIFGPYFRHDRPYSSIEVGIQVQYKSGDDKGFPNFPGIMSDFKDGQNTGLTALEMDAKVGPRFGWFYPRIGYVIGYRFETDGFQIDGGEQEVSKLYVHLPFGFGTNWKTRFGSVGTGLYYIVGITNVLKNPDPGSLYGGFYNGGRMHAVNVEITCAFRTKKY